MRHRARKSGGLGSLLLVVLLLTACGSGDGSEDIAWQPYVSPTAISASPTMTASHASPIVPTVDVSRRLSEAELQTYQPNELGRIPIPMYHAFVLDDQAKTSPDGGDDLDEWTRTLSEFREDLQWYYDRDFYVISMRSYLENDIRVPAGKHPLVLTFDDGSTRQAMWLKDKHGKIIADPDSALGVMEAFYAEHPDFGRGGYFAVLVFNCFDNPNGPAEMADCPTRLNWMIDHGYEIGNHTDGHQDLTDISDDEFLYQIGHPILWFRANIEEKGDLSDVLTLPYGAYPDRDLHPDQWEWLVGGFDYHGRQVNLQGILQVNGGPSPSPSSITFDRYGIYRFNTDPDVLSYWHEAIDNGDVKLYTSDGNPDIVTVPEDQAAYLNTAELDDQGKDIVLYTPSATPSATPHASARPMLSITMIDRRPRG